MAEPAASSNGNDFIRGLVVSLMVEGLNPLYWKVSKSFKSLRAIGLKGYAFPYSAHNAHKLYVESHLIVINKTVQIDFGAVHPIIIK